MSPEWVLLEVSREDKARAQTSDCQEQMILRENSWETCLLFAPAYSFYMDESF